MAWGDLSETVARAAEKRAEAGVELSVGQVHS